MKHNREREREREKRDAFSAWPSVNECQAEYVYAPQSVSQSIIHCEVHSPVREKCEYRRLQACIIHPHTKTHTHIQESAISLLCQSLYQSITPHTHTHTHTHSHRFPILNCLPTCVPRPSTRRLLSGCNFAECMHMCEYIYIYIYICVCTSV